MRSVGIITTEGFRDVLEIGRQMRHQMYQLALDPETPTFLAPGRMRREVPERISATGEVLKPLDEAAVADAADALVAAGAKAIAVVFLFSFLDDRHEKRAKEIIAARHPDVFVSLSSEVDPTFREYERTVVTAFDAYVKPVVDRYLANLDSGLLSASVPAPLQIMQSRGGISGSGTARLRPVRLFLSGPAAGVIGAKMAAEIAGVRDLITVDVGGTSCDIALIEGGTPALRSEGIIDRLSGARRHGRRQFDRFGRRLDRMAGRRGWPARRSAVGGLGAGTCLLRPRRHRGDRH